MDCYGNVHFCQGIVIGNVRRTPLPRMLDEPAARFGRCTEGDFVDACHLCFEVRRAALEEYPEILAPPQVYGR